MPVKTCRVALPDDDPLASPIESTAARMLERRHAGKHLRDTGTAVKPVINCPHCSTPSTRRPPSLRTQWPSISQFPNNFVFRLDPVGLSTPQSRHSCVHSFLPGC